ncbi:MAG: ethylbenzene dehydrogenase-related protein, partial [Pseudomonadota bacterium]
MRTRVLMLGLSLAAAGPAAAADPATIDWGKIKPTSLTLFYPGQSSYEWLRSAEHAGAQLVAGDGACLACHKGAEKKLGANLVKPNKLEPAAVKGKDGYKEVQVKVAYDDKNSYWRFQWKTNSNQPGIEYPYYRFDGRDWKVYGEPALNKAVREGKQPGIYEDRLSLMIDDGKVPGFANQGCWLTCHTGERDMPGVASKEDAQKVMKKNDIRKYLPASRSNPSDWRTIKSPEELARIKAEGGFVDLIQWRAHRSNPMGGADDGYVLEYRLFDKGKNHFASNMDNEKKVPKFMYDAAKFKSMATTAKDVGKRDPFLIKGVNAVPFDPQAGWKEGDMVPRYFLQPAEESAADNAGKGAWKDGIWTVVITRPLGLANADDKALKEGGVYTVGFAVHDDNITTRGHQVSFPVTVGFGAKADI